MRVLVLGAGGMLGHKLLQRLRTACEVAGTVRSARSARIDPASARALVGAKIFPGVDASDPAAIARTMQDFRPQAVLNCIGIIKQLEAAQDPASAIAINALLPHQIAGMAHSCGARLIHFGTDCVFSGARGRYTEDDPADADDLYGRCKRLGEVSGPGCLTIRSSVIGHELNRHLSLIDWFLSQRGGRIKGFAGAIYTGLPTIAMAEVVVRLLTEHPDLEGLWHVSADPISKYDLLCLVDQVYGLGIEIERDEEFACDRSLDSTRFRAATGWRPPPWPELVRAMHADYLDSRAGWRQ